MKHRSRGFSLLEVTVAVGILSLAMTLILTGQAGLAAANSSAAKMSKATTLGRCRMTEIEEKLLKYGYTETDETDSSDQCCQDDDSPGFSCEWKIERIVLPNPGSGLSADGGTGSSALSAITGTADSLADGGSAPLPTNFDGGLQSLGQGVAGQFGTAGADGIMSMAFTLVYPTLKPVLENSIRRVGVTVKWNDGEEPRTFVLEQYLADPRRTGMGGEVQFSADGGIIGAPTMPSIPGLTLPGTGAASTGKQ